jgi:hypothetical protein
MENELEHPVYSKSVLEFVAVANEYCSTLEQARHLSKKDLVVQLQKMLPLLYFKMSMVPPFETVLEETNEKFVTEQDWNYILGVVKSKMGKHDDFLEVFDPAMQEREEPVNQSISENLADIYQALKDFLMLYRMGNEDIMNDAVWEVSLNFESEWGQKLANLIGAFHRVAYAGEDLEDEGYKPFTEDDLEDMNTNDWLISKKMRNSEEDNEDV